MAQVAASRLVKLQMERSIAEELLILAVSTLKLSAESSMPGTGLVL
jgi:hypothetical protein